MGVPISPSDCKELVTSGTPGYLKAGMSAASVVDDSKKVNVLALPTRRIEMGMLLLDLGVWLYAAAALAGVIPPVSLPGPGL